MTKSFEDLLKMTEDKLLRDIADFEAILARMSGDSVDPQEEGLRRIYVDLLATRREMLTRLRADRR